jgi:hypothetical protein
MQANLDVQALFCNSVRCDSQSENPITRNFILHNSAGAKCEWQYVTVSLILLLKKG